MIIQDYPVPAKFWEIEFEVKRSKFLTFAANAESRAQAEAFIHNLREKHPKANHVCWAYIAGDPNTTIRSMSDNGEPSGTAGMPMLKVLEHSGYGDIVVAVVRYFGGTKLGTGGLQSAYSDAVSLVLADLPTALKVDRTILKISYDYTHDGSISRLLARYDVKNIDAKYAQKVTLSIAMASSDLRTFKSELTNVTAGNVEILLADTD